MLRGFLILSLAGAVIAVAIRVGLPRVLARRGVSFWWHTRFGPALVFDSADADGTTVRLLNVAGTYQSVCYVDEDLRWVPVCEYHRTWAHQVNDTFGRRSGGRRALVLGGGGYSFPKWLVVSRPDFACTAVEIDPAITQIARDWFFLDELMVKAGSVGGDGGDGSAGGRLRLVNADAWEVLAADTEGFDLIVNDVFSGNRPMGVLSTEEGARLVHSHLHDGGLYIGNVRTPLAGRGADVLRKTTAAFEEVFSHVAVVPERPENPKKKGNNALFAWR